MTNFEAIGVERQIGCSNKFQCRKQFNKSCEMCSARNLPIDCDCCANVNNFVTLMPDDEGNKWIITAGMVEVVSTVEAPDVDFGEDFMKALGVA